MRSHRRREPTLSQPAANTNITTSMPSRRFSALALAAATLLPSWADSPRPAPKSPATPKAIEVQTPSTFSFGGKPDEQTLEITNVAYEVTAGFIPGRPQQERLVLRKTVHSKEIIGDMDMEGTVTLEAWPLGSDLKRKPIYTLSVTGVDGKTVDGTLFNIARGLQEVEWWSIYKLGTAQHLFDTYVPLVGFSISREIMTQRYAGLEVPPDDISDARLKEPHVVAVLTYASAEKVIREALITCDDPQKAAQLRSFADETRAMSLVEMPSATGKGEPARSLKITFSQTYPSPPAPVSVVIPVAHDDLDLAHVQLPAKMHISAWKR